MLLAVAEVVEVGRGISQSFGRSEGDQAKLQLPGTATSALKEDFQPDVQETAAGGVHQQQRFFGSYAAHCSG
jgi:hypothetical protein